MPVCNYDGEVIGVAQIMNKRDGENHAFTQTDLKVRQYSQITFILVLFNRELSNNYIKIKERLCFLDNLLMGVAGAGPV